MCAPYVVYLKKKKKKKKLQHIVIIQRPLNIRHLFDQRLHECPTANCDFPVDWLVPLQLHTLPVMFCSSMCSHSLSGALGC